MIKNIVKRDGRVVSYDDGKIVRAIQKAMDAAGHTAKAGEAAIIAAAASGNITLRHSRSPWQGRLLTRTLRRSPNSAPAMPC